MNTKTYLCNKAAEEYFGKEQREVNHKLPLATKLVPSTSKRELYFQIL